MLFDEFADGVIEALDPSLLPSVLPIAALNPNPQRMRQHGTGTLLAVADKHFLVTAWHVLRDAAASEIPLFISDRKGECGPIPLEGLNTYRYDCPSVDDVPILDVCILELTESIVKSMPNRSYVNLSQVDLSGETKPGIYYIYGYPCEMAESDDDAKTIKYDDPFGFLTIPYAGKTDDLPTYDSHFHLLLNCPQHGSVSLRSSLRPRPNKLVGISGCSLWRVLDEGAKLKEWKPEHARIVGVQSSVFANEIVKGVRWRTVVAFLWKEYPDLRMPIRVSHPDVTDDLRELSSQLIRLLGT